MAWLHTWSGLVLGWLLYFVFLTGTAGYFDTEIDRWMKPELPMAAAEPDLLAIANAAIPVLAQKAPGATSWTIGFPIDRNRPYPQIFWQGVSLEDGAIAENGNIAELDLNTGERMPARETNGGQFLYRLHYTLHYIPRLMGYWLVGIASMLMLVAIVSGIITHKKYSLISSHCALARASVHGWTPIMC